MMWHIVYEIGDRLGGRQVVGGNTLDQMVQMIAGLQHEGKVIVSISYSRPGTI
jgi:hypothetical protein